MNDGHYTEVEPQTVRDPADLVDLMRGDLACNGDGWENATLEDFLEALSAVLRSGEGSLLGGNGCGLSCKEIAAVLKAAAISE